MKKALYNVIFLGGEINKKLFSAHAKKVCKKKAAMEEPLCRKKSPLGGIFRE